MSHRKILWQGVKGFCLKATVTLFFLCHGCAAHKQTIEVTKAQEGILIESEEGPLVQKAREHWLYRVVPRGRDHLAWYDPRWATWALFGNDDDGIFGEEISAVYSTSRKIGVTRASAWQVRNPLHNFCFYVIGSADKVNDEITFLSLSRKGARSFQRDPVAKTVFADEGTSFFFGLHRWKPFISLRLVYGSRRFDAYLGWRERGNFGIKCIPCKRHRKKVYSPKENMTYEIEAVSDSLPAEESENV